MVAPLSLTLSLKGALYTVRDASTTPFRVPPHHGNETTTYSHERLSLEPSNLANVREVAADINARKT
jgi:hypothetical protein